VLRILRSLMKELVQRAFNMLQLSNVRPEQMKAIKNHRASFFCSPACMLRKECESVCR